MRFNDVVALTEQEINRFTFICALTSVKDGMAFREKNYQSVQGWQSTGF